MNVRMIETDINKCRLKACMEFCEHFNRDKNLAWH